MQAEIGQQNHAELEQAKLEHNVSGDLTCCHDAGAANPAPTQTLQTPVSPVVSHAPAPVVALVPAATYERDGLTPNHPDVEISPQAVLCTFLI
jgi:hypothetical protein